MNNSWEQAFDEKHSELWNTGLSDEWLERACVEFADGQAERWQCEADFQRKAERENDRRS